MARFFGKFSFDYHDLPTLFCNIGVFLRVSTVNINRDYTQLLVQTKRNWTKCNHWTKISFTRGAILGNPSVSVFTRKSFSTMARHQRRGDIIAISCICYFTVIFSGVCYTYTYIISSVWFVLVKCSATGNFTSAMVAFSLTMCSITAIPKFCYMKCYSKTIMNIVDDYLHCNEHVVKGTRFETNILKVLRIIKKQATTAWTVLTVNGIIYAIVPFLRPGRHFSEDLFVLYGLDPMVESPNYEIASIMLTGAVYFAVTLAVHITLFIIVIIGYIEAQMSALSIELTNIWDDSEKFYNSYKHYKRILVKDRLRNIFLKKRLQDIVRFQILNINLRNKVEKELRCFFVTDFLFTLLALVTELVGGLENTVIQMPFTFGIVFIDCYIGQRLIDASTAFESAVYNCKWENFDVSNQKTVLFMLQCSQKTLTLSAGGMAVLNFPTLMSVLRSTYSAYTTIKSSSKHF